MTGSSEESSGHGDEAQAPKVSESAPQQSATDQVLRFVALNVTVLAFIFVLNAYLSYWQGWPSADPAFGTFGLFGFEPPVDGVPILSWLQFGFYPAVVAASLGFIWNTPNRTLHQESEALSRASAFIARAAFWGVLLVGLVDGTISFIRVEGFLESLVGDELASDLGRSSFRGNYVHFPLLFAGLVIAYFSRSTGFVWLALLVVAAELQIVILRFIFSYEQAFMADLVRFWYGGLFLFSSAYTLLHEGHVRVDVLYSGFSERKKAWTNAIGSILLGAPVCWVVLMRGLAEKSSVISSPLLNFEITQSGFGMYVKYLLAGFLLVYALTMLLQFMSYFLNNAGYLLHEKDAELAGPEEAHV